MRRATWDALSASFKMRLASGRKLRLAGVSRTERLVPSHRGPKPVGADKEEGAVERAGPGRDIADEDGGGVAGEIAEGVNQAARHAAALLRRGVGDDAPPDRADALAEEGEPHETNDQRLS